MQPSNKLIREVEDAVSNQSLNVENGNKWIQLFHKIPIPGARLQSTVTEFSEIASFFEPKKDGSLYPGAIFWYIFCLRDDDEFIGVKFFPNNKARIDTLEESDVDKECYPELIEIRFSGFEGTWEEVVRKVLEASKIIVGVPSAPAEM